jgi:hypothetical protein
MIKLNTSPFFLIFSILCCSRIVLAQESVNASGGDAKGAGGSVAYSVGQVVYTTHSAIPGSVAQGVQHAYEIFAVSTDDSEPNITVSVFPNPVSDALTLQIADYGNESLSFEMTDIQGRLLEKTLISSKDTQIDMAAHPASTYLLHIMSSNNKKIKTFKIIKN